MENQELMRYLKDAIEQETSIVEQENAISEYDRLSLLRKPKQQIDHALKLALFHGIISFLFIN